MKVLVGSENPVKLEAVKEAFTKYFGDVEIIGIGVESHVPAQPVNDETYIGAQSRAIHLKELNEKDNLGGDYFVGIEGGIAEEFDKWFAFGAMCIMDKKGRIGLGTSPHFELPKEVAEKLLSGIELGDVIDELTSTENSKQHKGAIGFFTNGVMNRKELYMYGLIVAMIPFLHEQLYFTK
ncbi:inosine/xanthosine triphosphatase [Bacteroidota bacterium]